MIKNNTNITRQKNDSLLDDLKITPISVQLIGDVSINTINGSLLVLQNKINHIIRMYDKFLDSLLPPEKTIEYGIDIYNSIKNIIKTFNGIILSLDFSLENDKLKLPDFEKMQQDFMTMQKDFDLLNENIKDFIKSLPHKDDFRYKMFMDSFNI